MIEVSRDGAVATMRLDHGAVNATDLELLEAIADTVATLDADPEVGAVVVTGNDRAFSAGVDLRRLLAEDTDHTRAFLDALSRAFLAPLRAETPVVAAVNGHAVAGGAVLAAACDHAIMTDDPRAKIGLAELAVGVPFPPVPLEIMRRRLGARLGEAVWTAALYGPADARDRGFVDEVVPADEVLDRATALADRLAALPAVTRRVTHEQLTRDVEDWLAARRDDHEAEVVEAWCSEEVRGAIRAYVERTLGG
jgi:enoyl-CoA hydratase